MYDIRQSTAITVPMYVHDENGDAVTGLTNASFTKRISKNGAAFAAMTVTITEMELGWYSFPLSTTHSNTLGILSITFTNAGAKQVNLQWRVQAKLTDDLNDFNAATDTVANVTTVATTTAVTNDVGITQAGADKAWATTARILTAATNITSDSSAISMFASGILGTVNLVTTTATNTDMRGTDGANTVVPDNAGIAQNGVDIGNLIDFNPAADTVVNVTNVAAATLDPTAQADLVDDIFDEILPGAHNITNSAGSLLIMASQTVAIDGSVVDASPTAAGFDTNLTEVDDAWRDNRLKFTDGILAGQSAPITTYSQTNGAMTFDEPFTSAPGNGDNFDIMSDHIHPLTQISAGVWDEILTGAAHNVVDSAGRRLRDLQEFGVYENGAVWIDTVNGTPGTTDFESGTAFNPVNTIADANTLAASLGLTRFQIASGSTITLAASQNNQAFIGENWTLALGVQDIGGTLFMGAAVSGTGTGTSQIKFIGCALNGTTLHPFEARRCSLGGDMILQGTTPTDSDYFFHQCFSEIAGTATPSIDFGAVETDTNVNMRDYSGGIEVKNMGQAGVDNMSLEGDGQLIINANCSGGTIAIRGNFTVTDNAGGAVTLVDDARYDITQINTEVGVALNTTVLTESYAADGAEFTAAQGLYEINQSLNEFAIVSTTYTVKERDGATTALTYTLDSATVPTSKTRIT